MDSVYTSRLLLPRCHVNRFEFKIRWRVQSRRKTYILDARKFGVLNNKSLILGSVARRLNRKERPKVKEMTLGRDTQKNKRTRAIVTDRLRWYPHATTDRLECIYLYTLLSRTLSKRRRRHSLIGWWPFPSSFHVALSSDKSASLHQQAVPSYCFCS